MTTRSDHWPRTHPVRVLTTSPPPEPLQRTSPSPTRDGAGAWLEHSFSLTAATLDRPRASDVAASPRKPLRRPGRTRRPRRGVNRADGDGR
jgi:hypothetical protein